MSVAAAAAVMGVCKRQALRLLVRRNEAVGGRLLRSVGNKRMPRGVQSSKYLVSMTVFREAMRPDDTTKRDLEALTVEVALLRQQVGALRRVVRAIEQGRCAPNGT